MKWPIREERERVLNPDTVYVSVVYCAYHSVLVIVGTVHEKRRCGVAFVLFRFFPKDALQTFRQV